MFSLKKISENCTELLRCYNIHEYFHMKNFSFLNTLKIEAFLFYAEDSFNDIKNFLCRKSNFHHVGKMNISVCYNIQNIFAHIFYHAL